MSEGMIIRRGGSVGGLSPNNAILKVVTSTGCSVTVSNSTAGYSKTHADSDGFVWSSDANVKDHFFEVPSSAFGTITVTVSKVYTNGGVSETLTSSKTVSVSAAGKTYEVYVAAANIILDSTFGLQSGYSWANAGTNIEPASYDDRYKKILPNNSASTKYTGGYISPNIPVTAFSTLTVTGIAKSAGYEAELVDSGDVTLCDITSSGEQTATITNKYYPDAKLKIQFFKEISKIVLS